MINDLKTLCPTFKYIDDSTIYDVCTKSSSPKIQIAADQAASWSSRNAMKINAAKTKELVVCFCHDKGHHTKMKPIIIDGDEIERVQSAKLLSVTISNDLTWNAHIEDIIKKASKRIFMLYQLKRAGIKQCDMLKIYLTVIRPVTITAW